MTPLNVVFDLPAALANGLQNGAYERVGGVIRDSNSKQVVAWLREGGNGVVSQPPLPKLALGEAAQMITPMLSAVNLGVSVAGFAVVITQLNQISDQIRLIEAKVDRVSVKLDDLALAKLMAGVNACLNAVELGDANLRQQMAGQALTALHEARHYFNQQVLRSAAKAEATSAEYVSMAFAALVAEVQTYLQLDEGEKAARTLRQGLTDLRPGLTQLMNAVLERRAVYLRPDFQGQVDLDFILWLTNGFKRMQRTPGERAEEISASQLFDLLRPQLGDVFKNYEDWHGEIPPAVVDTSGIDHWRLGPIDQGVDKAKRFKFVKEELAKGLTKIAAVVEGHDRLCSHVLQLEELSRLGLKPSEFQARLVLPEGQAAAVMFDRKLLQQLESA
ncbi:MULTISPECIES: hypothetical protein [unclassified Synechococcus]|uniref:hypothetical protein n=1 Tax=unclassified Synechococcus TaxID=2626047 RepID=UPI001C24E4ED|nr:MULTISPECIES: hypothetical protein [unclassified Synechococcus]